MAATVAIPWLTGRGDRRDRRAATATSCALYAVIVVLAALLRVVLSVARRLVAGRVSLGVEVDLRNRVYAHLQSLELGFFARHADRPADVARDGRPAERALLPRLRAGVHRPERADDRARGGRDARCCSRVWRALALAPVPFVVLVAARYGRRSRPALQEVQQRIAELTADVEENVSGVRVVKAFAAEERQLERFRGSGRARVRPVDGRHAAAGVLQPVHRLPAEPRPGRDPAGRRPPGDAGTLTLGDFTAFYAYLLMLIGPMRQLGIALGLAQRATASGARMFELLDREPRLVAPARRAGRCPPGGGRVELRDVTFAYEGAATPALRDVYLVVEAGTTVALVGATGSGKTTLVQLLGRLYDVDRGLGAGSTAPTCASVDLRSLRRAIAVVDDDPFLFSATVHDNIAYGRPEATREEVERAAERAQAAGFIDELPDGYDTRVGERGLTLSGGQRQRIAIARALLADPRILVLDDATSSVDASTEQAIKEALREVMAGRTTFVIAHRLSTIALADEIVVLEDGRVVARGTHDELLERSALYAEIAEKGLPDQVFLNREPHEAVAGL